MQMNIPNPNIPGNTNPVPHIMEDGVDRLARGAHHGIDVASGAARPAIDSMTSGAHRAVDSADVAVKHAAEALERAGVRGEQLVAVGTGYMREHPALTIGLAVAAGYLLSRLLDAR